MESIIVLISLAFASILIGASVLAIRNTKRLQSDYEFENAFFKGIRPYVILGLLVLLIVVICLCVIGVVPLDVLAGVSAFILSLLALAYRLMISRREEMYATRTLLHSKAQCSFRIGWKAFLLFITILISGLFLFVFAPVAISTDMVIEDAKLLSVVYIMTFVTIYNSGVLLSPDKWGTISKTSGK